jgi:PAS domain S-box-containing protein
MALHPGERKRHFLDEAPVIWDPIRRVLEENEDWYRDLVEHSQDLLCVHDLEGRFLSVNPVPARLLGYSVEEALRMRLQDVIDPQFRDQCDAYLRDIGRTGESRGLMAVVTRSGEQRIWEYHNTLRTAGVAAPIVRGTAHDVTERVRAQMALRASHSELLKKAREQERMLKELTLFRTLLDQSNDAIEVIDPETLRFLDVNERACVELGYSREELLSMTVFDIDRNIDESWRAWVRQRVLESGFAIMERVHRRKDGTTLPVEVNFRRVRLDREYGVAVSRDITARKRTEEKLREFEGVVESLEEMIVVVNREHRYVLENQAFLSRRGMTREQVTGRLAADVLNPEAYETVIKQKLDECFKGEIVNYELRYKYPEIGERDIAITYIPLEGPSGIDRVASVMRDITEQKRAEERLREFERVVENLEEMIVVVNREYRYVIVNRAFLTYRGLTIDQVVGRLAAASLDPEVFEMVVKEKLDECFQGKVVNFELKYRYPELGERDVSITYLPIEGAAGIDRVACIFRDITERKQAEQSLQEAQAELAHVTRVLAMGELVTSIAHEVNQPLTGVVTNSDFALRQLASGSPNLEQLREAIAEIVEDARRVSAIISRVRTLLKKGAPDRVALAINDVIQDVTVLVRNEAARNGVQVRLDLAPVLPPLVGDRVQLQQVLINLVMNGIDAMRSVTDRPRKLDIKSAKHADGVLIQVRDSGLGLAQDRLERVFEPFFTTKPQGIGMGLSISRSIIESHGGRLWTVPVPNGALFQFTLPTNWNGVS